MNLAACGIALVFIIGMWALINASTRKTDDHHKMFVEKNQSYLMQRFGIALAQAIAIYPTLGQGAVGWSALWWTVLSGGVMFVVILVAYPIMRTVIGRNKPVPSVVTGGDDSGYSVRHSPRDPDKAVTDPFSIGLVVAGFYLAFGLAVNGVFSGGAPTQGLDGATITVIVVFVLLGVLIPVLMYFVNDQLTTRLLGYSTRVGVREGRVASGLEALGMLIAQGIIMQAAISGEFTNWGNALLGFFSAVVLVQLATYVARWLFDLFILVGTDVGEIQQDDNSIPLAAFVAGIPAVMAIIMTPLAVSFASLGL